VEWQVGWRIKTESGGGFVVACYYNCVLLLASVQLCLLLRSVCINNDSLSNVVNRDLACSLTLPAAVIVIFELFSFVVFTSY
jgi:hypothetical protein